MADTEISDAAAYILAHLWSTFTAPGVLNPPTKYMMAAGPEATQDIGDCCEGLLYVLCGESTPLVGSESIPGKIAWTQRFFAGVMRCMPTMDSNGNPPSEAEESAAAVLVLTDQKMLMRGIMEAAWSSPEFADGDLSDLTVTQTEPSGGCCGAVAVFTLVMIEDC